MKIILSTMAAWGLSLMMLICMPGGVLADELTDAEKTDAMKKIEKALAEDGISTADWEKDKYECWHIARDVQVGLWNNESFDSALARVKFTKDSETKQHFVLETNWKVGGETVYIEPATGKLYKGVDNLMENYSGDVSDVKVASRYSRVQISIEIVPCAVPAPDGVTTITVTLTDRSGAVSPSGPAGQPLKQQPLSVTVTKSDGSTVPFPAASNKTDANGKWTTTLAPCPQLGSFKVEVEVATQPVPAQAKRSCRCIRDLQECILPLSPWTSLNPVGTPHEVLATPCDYFGNPLPGQLITFTVIDGPHTGVMGDSISDINGNAYWSYPGINTGVDTIVATCFYMGPGPVGYHNNSLNLQIISNEVYKEWEEEWAPSIEPPAPPYVGGTVMNTAKLKLLAPWIVLAVAVTGITLLLGWRLKKGKTG